MNIKNIEASAYKQLGNGFLGLVKKAKGISAVKYVLEETKKEEQDMIASFSKKLEDKDAFISSQDATITEGKAVSNILKENISSAQLGLRYLNKLLKSRIKLGDASVIDYRKCKDIEYIKIKQIKTIDSGKKERITSKLLSILEENQNKPVINLQDKNGNTKYTIFSSYDNETGKLKYVLVYKFNPNKQEPVSTSEYNISFDDDKVIDISCALGNPKEYTLFKDFDTNMQTKKISYRKNNREYAQIEYV